MYAIVESGGKQYRVEPGKRVTVDRLPAEVGAEIVLSRVLLVGGDQLVGGSPLVEGAAVQARVVDHVKGPREITFKMKAKKRTRRRVGSRSSQTTLEILGIKA
jgi:large subunit ribosomal protein L21